MDNWDKRAQGTAVVWILVTAITAIVTFGGSPGDTDWILITLLIAAGISTAAIWLFGSEEIYKSGAEHSHQEKAKRRGADQSDPRTALLMDLLDAEEKEQLKRRLIDDLSADGDALSLNELLSDQHEQRRRR